MVAHCRGDLLYTLICKFQMPLNLAKGVQLCENVFLMFTRKSMNWVVFFVFIAFFVTRPLRAETETDRAKSPPFELTSLSGKSFTEKDLLGKTTLLVFWASWCDVCKHELPKAGLLHEKLGERSFQVIGIGFGDSEQSIREYVKSHPDVFSFPVLYDTGDQVASRFGTQVTPTFFLFDKEGQLIVPYRGGGLFEHPQFRKILSELL